MRLVKDYINMNRIVSNTAMQIYINEEVTISEANQPVAGIVKESANAVVDSIKVRDDQLGLAGTLEYSILYLSEGSTMVQGLQGEILFDEMIRMPGLREENDAHVRLNVDNISIKVVNPRKLLIKAEITAYATAEEMASQVAASNVEGQEEVAVLKKKLGALSMVVDKTDTFRVKDDISIPNGKSSIYKIVWKDIRIKNVATRLMDKMMHIGGEVYVFIMYIPDDDSMPQQWHEATLPFGGTVEIPEVSEDMISYVDVGVQNVSLELNTNDLGESRDVSANILLTMDIKVYEEREMEILEDVYSPFMEMTPVCTKGAYHKLLVKNSSRSKNSFKLSVDQSKGNILQICNSGADLKVDSIEVIENGLLVKGKIKAYVIYVSSNDREPVCTACKEVDFAHKIDAEGISKDDEYYMNWKMEQVTANMISTEEIEIKAVAIMDTIVFKNCMENMIIDVEEEPLDMERLAQLPTVKGHVVQDGETLWNIAKENYTTVDKIMEANMLKSDQVKKGDRLLIVKAVRK